MTFMAHTHTHTHTHKIFFFLILCRDCVQIAKENDVSEIPSYVWFLMQFWPTPSKCLKSPSLYWQI